MNTIKILRPNDQFKKIIGKVHCSDKEEEILG
jgi:hypothetical protein